MSDTDLPNEDNVLRRMLNTPHEKHKPLGHKQGSQAPVEPEAE